MARSIYISGPMRSKPAFNFPAFFEAEDELRHIWPDADICNPAREDVIRFRMQRLLKEEGPAACGQYLLDHPELFDQKALQQALGEDMEFICKHADLVIVLEGWEKSKGAVAEVTTAYALGVPVHAKDGNRFYPVSIEENVSMHEQEESTTIDLNTEGPNVVVQPGRTVVLQPGDIVTGETRTVSTTGGEKGVKLAAFDQVSPEVELLVAEHFGKGARKYSAHNFRKGYEWSKSYSALRRHLAAFWAGEEYDDHTPECPPDCTDHTGSLHIVAVIWHAMVLTEFYLHHKEFDDRYGY